MQRASLTVARVHALDHSKPAGITRDSFPIDLAEQLASCDEPGFRGRINHILNHRILVSGLAKEAEELRKSQEEGQGPEEPEDRRCEQFLFTTTSIRTAA